MLYYSKMYVKSYTRYIILVPTYYILYLYDPCGEVKYNTLWKILSKEYLYEHTILLYLYNVIQMQFYIK